MVEETRRYQSPPALPAGESAPWRFAETVAGALFSPGRTLREVGQREAIMPAMLLVFLLALISVVAQLAAVPGTLSQAPTGAENLVALQVTSVLGNLLWAPVFWAITAGLLYGSAYLLGGRGRFQALWAATGFALTPQFLVAPLGPITQLAGMLGAGWQVLGFLVSVPFYLAAFVWTLVLMSIAVRETMNLSGGRAFGAVALLIGAVLLLAILALCVFFLMIFGLIAALA